VNADKGRVARVGYLAGLQSEAAVQMTTLLKQRPPWAAPTLERAAISFSPTGLQVSVLANTGDEEIANPNATVEKIDDARIVFFLFKVNNRRPIVPYGRSGWVAWLPQHRKR
jgi:hypothetical protein